uniref:hypothetical protein n=1 Tax=Flavobacterium sp. TaxID=239 RepID=UPI0040499DDA
MNQIKTIVTILIAFIPTFTFGQANPFQHLKFDKVVAFEYDGEGGLLIENCLGQKDEKIKQKRTLTAIQIQKITTILTSNTSYGNTTMSCFDPHFALVYYLKNEIVGTISICLDCNYLISSEKIPATELKMISISEDYAYPANGFSKTARKEIHDFCNEIGFTAFLKPLTSYLDQ